MVHPVMRPVRTVSHGRFVDVGTYELMFELVARIKESGLQAAGARQLLVVGRACVEELGRRAQKKDNT